MSYNGFKKIGLGITIATLTLSGLAYAGGKTYTENEFLDTFSAKSKQVVTSKLGAPAKKELSVKPTNAGALTGQNVDEKNSKQVKVEMWYYKNVVRYDAKRTYKETEITFVNDHVLNIAFFNNR
ncbi:MAG: hypothetical protein ACKVOA_01015 [Methylophilaceae bacterium]